VRALVLLGAALALAGCAAATAEAPPTEAIERVVRDYLVKHPEVVVEALRAMEERQRAAEHEQARAAIRARQDDLLRDPASPVGGNPQGDVTVVEFFDYNCPHCRRAAETVARLTEEDTSLRVVYKELPILGPDSVLATRVALAAHAQGKYLELHRALMATTEALTGPAVLEIARGLGLDAARLEAEMGSAEITAAIEKNRALAQALGVSGTPAFVVGTDLVPGAIGLEAFRETVGRARQR